MGFWGSRGSSPYYTQTVRTATRWSLLQLKSGPYHNRSQKSQNRTLLQPEHNIMTLQRNAPRPCNCKGFLKAFGKHPARIRKDIMHNWFVRAKRAQASASCTASRSMLPMLAWLLHDGVGKSRAIHKSKCGSGSPATQHAMMRIS